MTSASAAAEKVLSSGCIEMINFKGTGSKCVGWARTIYTRCVFGIFGREITRDTVIYGVYTRFWPTL
jgi:hypothetical protein